MYNIAYKQNCTNALLTNVHTKFAGLPLLPKYIKKKLLICMKIFHDTHRDEEVHFYKMKYEFHFIFPDSLCK